MFIKFSTYFKTYSVGMLSCMIFRINKNFSLKKHQTIGFCKHGAVCFMWRNSRIINSNLDERGASEV